jgi:hypothetical protein
VSLPFGAHAAQAPVAAPRPDAVRERLSSIDPDALSPREAQQLVYDLVELLNRPPP